MDNNEFNLQDLLDKVLQVSKGFAESGKSYAEDILDIPEDEAGRVQKLDGLKKGAIATAVLVGLLGTKGGRSLTGSVIKVGGVAALGTAAYKGYQSWREGKFDDAFSIHKLEGNYAQKRAFLLISAMVSAANADGKLDDEESTLLKREVLDMKLPSGLFEQVSEIVDRPLNVTELAARVDNELVAAEVYMAARIFIDNDSTDKERMYLEELVTLLSIDAKQRIALDQQLNTDRK